jgi:hypothetical protein
MPLSTLCLRRYSPLWIHFTLWERVVGNGAYETDMRVVYECVHIMFACSLYLCMYRYLRMYVGMHVGVLASV